MPQDITVFEENNIRRIRDEKKEKRYFSIIDIVGILIEEKDHQAVRNYWKVLKHRLKTEGSEMVTNCDQLKMLDPRG